MIESYITGRMCAWAKVALRGSDGGLGFKRQVSFANNMPHGGIVDYTPEIDEAFHQMDLCVQALSIESPELYTAITLHYLRGDITAAAKAKSMKLSLRSFYNRISIAHNLLLGWLNDLAAGIEIPHREKKLKKIA